MLVTHVAIKVPVFFTFFFLKENLKESSSLHPDSYIEIETHARGTLIQNLKTKGKTFIKNQINQFPMSTAPEDTIFPFHLSQHNMVEFILSRLFFPQPTQ